MDNNNLDIHIVDDDELLAELFVEIVEDAGYVAKSFCNAEEYLEYANSSNYFKPTLAVVTDVKMTGKSGYELIKEMKKINPVQRFVVVTGVPQNGIDKGVRACFYLKKPVDIDKMQTIFNKLSACANYLTECQCDVLKCKELSDLDAFGIKDWECPFKKNIPK